MPDIVPPQSGPQARLIKKKNKLASEHLIDTGKSFFVLHINVYERHKNGDNFCFWLGNVQLDVYYIWLKIKIKLQWI